MDDPGAVFRCDYSTSAPSNEFLVRHVPRCDCPRPVICTRSDLHAASAHLLDVLRERQVIAERPREVGHIADELHRYDDYMQRVQGLIEGTRRGRLRMVRRLLLYKFADGPVVVAGLEPDEVRKFIAQQLDLRGGTSNATAVTSALTSLLPLSNELRRSGARFTRRDREARSLEPCSFATRAQQRRSEPFAQLVRRLLAVTPTRLCHGALCAGYGAALQRSGQAAARRHRLARRHGDVEANEVASRGYFAAAALAGRALADYLRYERPKTTNPAVFVRRQAPRDQPIGVDAVRRVIRDAYARIGLTHGRAHALRHTVASGCSIGRLDQGGRRCAAPSLAQHLADLRQARSAAAGGGRLALAGECNMSAITITTGRRCSWPSGAAWASKRAITGYALLSFARFMDRQYPKGLLTIERMTDWARRDKQQRRTPATWARRLKQLRPFARWLRQFEPRTEVPDESVFGPVPGRVAPHIYREKEIVALLSRCACTQSEGQVLRPAPTRHCSGSSPRPAFVSPRRWHCETAMSIWPPAH
jgi:integrase/recombinase XerC